MNYIVGDPILKDYGKVILRPLKVKKGTGAFCRAPVYHSELLACRFMGPVA